MIINCFIIFFYKWYASQIINSNYMEGICVLVPYWVPCTRKVLWFSLNQQQTVNDIHQDTHEVCDTSGYVLKINIFIESTASVSCKIWFLFTFFIAYTWPLKDVNKYGKRQEELKNIEGSKTEHSTITDWYKGLHEYFSMYMIWKTFLDDIHGLTW